MIEAYIGSQGSIKDHCSTKKTSREEDHFWQRGSTSYIVDTEAPDVLRPYSVSGISDT